jgi:ADP-dependent NAD(P)H-hydrate dehydratase
MSSRSPEPIEVTSDLLRRWPLPSTDGSKYSRGQVLVVGGARKSPGAAMLAGLAALRVGAGRLTLAIAESAAATVAAAVPECGVIALAETAGQHVRGDGIAAASAELSNADAIVIGPGLDDPDEAEALLRAILDLVPENAAVLLDAFALGCLPRVPAFARALDGRLLLTPNVGEAGRLLDRDSDGGAVDVSEIADRYGAVVSCWGSIAAPGGSVWSVGPGGSGLGTSGSGDVLAGAIAGLAARGASPSQAAVWATHAHAAAGERLSVMIAPLGYLASELLAELPRVLVEIGE